MVARNASGLHIQLKRGIPAARDRQSIARKRARSAARAHRYSSEPMPSALRAKHLSLDECDASITYRLAKRGGRRGEAR